MATRRIKLLALAVLAAAGGLGYHLLTATAQTAPPELAQAPLNVTRTIPTSFIMALDDSGSMIWETLNNTRDGVYVWRDNRFYNTSGTAHGYSDTNNDAFRFYYSFPVGNRGDNKSAFPPINAFGFARSPDINSAYFDPRLSYEPWKNGDGSDYLARIDPASAPIDPRPTGSNNKMTGTLNLTADIERNDNDYWRFQVHSGMVLPVGTVVRGTCNSTPGLPGGTNNNWRTLTASTRIDQSCRLAFRYYPATFFLRDRASLPATYGYTADPVEVTNPAGGAPGTLYKYEIKLANFGGNQAAYDSAMQNFANWFSYYRTRREGLIGSVTNALNSVSRMRVGWFRINNRNEVAMRDMSDAAQRTALFSEIHQMRASDSTPNRRAVQHMGQQFKRTNAGAPVQYSCQKNAGMLFTDGYINDDASPSVGGNLDGTRMPTAPFADSVSNTMADIVVPYYLDSLRPDLESNSVPVPAQCSSDNPDPRLDCQTNLHMNFYGITLGTRGRLFDVSYVADANNPSIVTPDPFVSPPTWHTDRENLTPNAVDEMWHATLNARGAMINARSPAAVTEAMKRILASVGEGTTPSGSIALTGARIGAGSLSVVPSYTAEAQGDSPPTDWYGELVASRASSNALSGQVTLTEAWRANAQLPAHASRNILFGRTGSSVRPTVAEFTASNLQAAGIGLEDLCAGPLAPSRCASSINGLGVSLDDAVSYLRGNRALEGSRLRSRTKLLGDIVNSTPVVTAGAVIQESPVVRTVDDYGYRALGGDLASSYATYLANKRTSGRQMVYVGANDGMLHAFDGATGAEVFAYMPATALGHLGNLLFRYDPADGAAQRFEHRYYVDGPVTISDAFIGGEWRTVMVGTAGAGGRSVFALDVTDPEDVEVLWEINDLITGADSISGNIGHVLGKPIIVPVGTGADTSWKVVFGNGYNSRSHDAALFVVNLEDGTATTIVASETSGDASAHNGLGNIVVVDRQRRNAAGNAWTMGSDGRADTVYAGDRNGALWKFDLNTETVAFDGVPLFVAASGSGDNAVRQPIMGGLDAAAGPGTATMVYFGTGSYSFVGDDANNAQQTFYAIIDRGAPVAGRADLLEQTVGSDSAGYRASSTNSISALNDGWYIDLPSGERFVGNPRVESGIVFFPAYQPGTQGGDICGLGGENWLYGLNALTGGAALTNVRVGSPSGSSPDSTTGAIKLDTSGTAPVTDVAAMTTPRVSPLASGTDPDDLEDALAARCSMVIQAPGSEPLYLPRPCGRQSWRQVR